jgi:hypothetical protein
MLYRLSRSTLTVLTVCLATFAFFILLHGLTFNVVMRNYCVGGVSFLNGQNPYEVTLQNGPSNQFKYSPFFAWIMAGVAKSGSQTAVLGLWALVGIAAFCFGLNRWGDLSKKVPFYVTIALLAALLDLVVSMAAYQVNALIIGLTLLGLAEYRDGRLLSAGAILSLAANLKVYPVVFLIALALFLKPRYWIGALSIGLATFLLPVVSVGWSHNLEMHLAWFRVVLGDSSGAGVMDLLSAFQRVGLSGFGQVLRWPVLVATIPLFFAYLPLARRADWRPWMTFGLAAILLLSPRTEVFTYVLLAPSYVVMTSWCAESGRKIVRTYGGILVTLLAVAIASCRFSDPNWYVSESPREIVRVIGALGFWVLTACILGSTMFGALKARMTDLRVRREQELSRERTGTGSPPSGSPRTSGKGARERRNREK